ncbi:MAG: hypothetical protein HY537_15940, partial [Deltaproteobacteria bacterium]|nr:hypothetical protein [Deltaproteobacteria bacterium]
MRRPFFIFIILFTVWIELAAASSQWVRWTVKDDSQGDFERVLSVLNQKTGFDLKSSDFLLIEDRDLAITHFKMFVQVEAGVPINLRSIRIWTSLRDQKLVQAEALVDSHRAPSELNKKALANRSLNSQATMNLVRAVIKNNLDDSAIRSVKWNDSWHGNDIFREFKITGQRGYHVVSVSLTEMKVVSYRYEEFPQTDTEFKMPIQIYPVYEEIEGEGTILTRIQSELRYLKNQVARPTTNPFQPLLSRRYLERQYDPILGLMPSGQAQGLWAMPYLKSQAEKLQAALALSDNSLASTNTVLEGRYATINLHPEVPKHFKNLVFTPALSAQFVPNWLPTPEDPREWEMIPTSTLRGKPIASADEAWNRPARRLPDHNPVSYINDGFDELQVYWAVNQMFDSLKAMGFTDPELSTRQFHAFLYDPDIAYRNNAYYHDDTINFTTYSPEEHNMARDNTTIWHELGHGVMDRLMGDLIRLADTGGLSEGMADLVAQFIIHDVTGSQPFPGLDRMRINNQTGFYLTNEVHDDGEAYGGAMNDLLLAAIAKDGKAGLAKVTDLVLESMRLCRNHPALTAQQWFGHMLFADELGNEPLRKPGELSGFVEKALSGRNFSMDGSTAAAFTLKKGNDEITATGPGSRPNPIPLKLKESETQSFKLQVNLKSSPTYAFKYPVTVKVQLR